MAFTALPGGSGVGGAYAVGDLWRPAIEATRTKENFDDHETRIVDVEDVLADDGMPRWHETVLTSGQLHALRATPQTIVPAPGAGKVNEFLGGVLILDFGTAAYVEGGNNLAVRYQGSSGVQVSDAVETTDFLTVSGDVMTNVRPKIDAIVASGGCLNQPLVLHNIGSSEFTSGDGVLRVKVGYRTWTAGW